MQKLHRMPKMIGFARYLPGKRGSVWIGYVPFDYTPAATGLSTNCNSDLAVCRRPHRTSHPLK